MPSTTADDAWTIADVISRGKVVFFLGAGVNMSGRAAGEQWTPDKSFLPKADELARVLVKSCGPAYEQVERRADRPIHRID